jgi:hypothetical protein
MATTYEIIASVTVSSATNTISFTSIPQTYTDLLFKISGRFSIDTSSAFLRYNGTTTNGTSIFLEGSGSSASSSTDGSYQYGPIHGVVNSTKTADTFGNANTQPLIYTEYPTHNERNTMPTKLIVDCSTGITTEVELTAEEIAEREAMAAEYAVQKAQEDAEAAAKAAAKASAQSKLAALGLTAEEIEALTK